MRADALPKREAAGRRNWLEAVPRKLAAEKGNTEATDI
jgi:hypothetical protein